MRQRLYRSDNRAIAGVCAGIAEHLGWDIGITRLGYLLLSIFSAGFPGGLVYIILWIVIPPRPGRTIYM